MAEEAAPNQMTFTVELSRSGHDPQLCVARAMQDPLQDAINMKAILRQDSIPSVAQSKRNPLSSAIFLTLSSM